MQLEDGTLEPREKGTPQGSVISPLLSNLFLHYTFDHWMTKHYRLIPFERFADDAVCHCVIDYCINNAIILSEVRYPYAQTEGKCRAFGRPSPSCFSAVG
ncbi:reverse transcriptase domain-containing protein [Telmatobacter bradus]|uniref:reverse transcriptase domain-containing protein n=1 Tax=Telmatobacter bradus TaxID=474953 RepID=UPI003B43203A